MTSTGTGLCDGVPKCMQSYGWRQKKKKKCIEKRGPLASSKEHQQLHDMITLVKIPLTPMGVLAPGSAHARPSAQPPIDVSGNFSPHVSAE
jgi:hypothetical protein